MTDAQHSSDLVDPSAYGQPAVPEPRRMPILGGHKLAGTRYEGRRYWPAGLGELLNAAYQAVEHNGQRFERLAERGGLGWDEGMSLLWDWYETAEKGNRRLSAPPPDVRAPQP